MLWPYQSKQSWIEQVLKDHPEKQITDIVQVTNDGLISDPFSFFTDVKHEINLEEVNKQNWKSGIRIFPKNHLHLTELIQLSLDNGIEWIQTDLTHIEDSTQLEYAFQNVMIDYLQLGFFLPSKHPYYIHFCEYFKSNADFRKALIISENSNPKDFLFTPAFVSNGTINSLADQLYKICNAPNKKDGTILLYHELNNDFLKNIYTLRASQIVLRNLSECLNNSSVLHVATITSKDFGKDPYSNLIQMSCMSVSAVLGGVDCLLLDSADLLNSDQDSKWTKASIHLQQIVKQEAKIFGFSDPLNGAYHIDDMTIKFANALWERLREFSKV